MHRNRVKELVTRMLLVISLLFGVVASLGTTAQAQGWQRSDRHYRNRGRVFVYPRRWYWHDRWFWRDQTYPFYENYYFPSSHVTEGQGYKDGLDDGKDDSKDRKAYDPYRHKDYKNAVTSAYINGYLRGYADGFRQISG